jgi:hypothetical protein
MRRTVQKVNQKQIENLAIEAFRSEGFLMLNKKMIKTIGLFPALLLSNYIDKYEYFRRKNVNHNGWFYFTHKQLIEQLGLAETFIRKYKHRLIKWRLLEVKCIGSPSKEWFKIDFVLLMSVLESGVLKSTGLGVHEPECLITKPKDNSLFCDEEEISKKPLGSNFPIVPNLFETFWKLYPRKVIKGKAFTSWNKLCKKSPKERPTWKVIKNAIKEQKESEQWQTSKYIPHPSTWLNQSRWMDDPNDLKGYNSKTEGKDKKRLENGKYYLLADDGEYYDRKGNLLE